MLGEVGVVLDIECREREFANHSRRRSRVSGPDVGQDDDLGKEPLEASRPAHFIVACWVSVGSWPAGGIKARAVDGGVPLHLVTAP